MTPRRNVRAPVRGWKPEFASQAERLCALGFTDAELAEFFDVTEAVIAQWRARLPGFARGVTRGRKRWGDRREPSLYRRAIGYTRETATPFFARQGGRPVIVVHEEHVPPETQAALAWLKVHFPTAWNGMEENRRPEPAPPQGKRTVIVLPHNGRESLAFQNGLDRSPDEKR